MDNQSFFVPNLVTALSETRVFLEFSQYFIKLPTLKTAPKGDNHPVLIIPGFATNDSITYLMRRYLKEQNFCPYPWGLGCNTGPREHLYEGIIKKIKDITNKHGEKISLVGWSLGGIFAREIAKEYEDEVRFVITLGSPFARNFSSSSVLEYFRKAGVKDLDYLDDKRLAQLNVSPPHPTTSIYSKNDLLINSSHCLLENEKYKENISITGSHYGLCHNPQALYILSDRLSQLENNWLPYEENIDISF